MKFLLKLLLLIFVVSLPIFANSVATITAVKGVVSIKNISGNHSANLGYKLEEKDSVITGEKSKAQIIFSDETIVTVGQNSNFSISEYIYDENSEPSVKFGLIRGAIRTITGKIGKIAPQRFVLKTKRATIGIRGTNFTVIVMQDGTQRAYCTYGAISVTINHELYLVKQGFFLSLSHDGSIFVREFSVKDLQDMKKNNFGKTKESKEELSDDEEFENDTLIDEIEEQEKSSVEEETDDDIKNAQQTESIPDDNKDDVILLSGWGANSRYYEEKATTQLKIVKETQTIDTDDSFVLDNEDSITQWKYTLKAIPDSFVNTTFESVTSNNANYSNYSIDPTKNYIRVVDDLSPDDKMYWGEWGIKVNYQESYQDYIPSSSDTATSFDNSREIDGLWVAGVLTENSVIASYNQDFARYDGEYRAYDFTNGNSLVKGVAQLDVNFANDTASLVIMKPSDSTSQWASYSMKGADTNHISGTQYQGNGSADGNFYGATGDLVGGNFDIKNSSNTDAKGVYQVKHISPTLSQ